MHDSKASPHRLATLAFLAVGILLTVLLLRYERANPFGIAFRLCLLPAALLIAFIPAARRILLRLAHPSPADRMRIAALIFFIATAYLACTAYYHGRELYPRLHDECSYIIGAHQVARGRLWLPQHELADFFESFHLLVKPVYASIYWPGTALMNAPGIWFGAGTFVIPIALAGLAVALAYRIVAELVDGAAGILVAVMLIGTPEFRIMSTVVLSQVPLTVLGLAMTWAWLRWRVHRKRRWAVLLGLFAGWAAVTRPVDALAFALPIGLAMALALRKHPWREWARNAGRVVLGAIPFLLLQLIFNVGVTGRLLHTPYQLYLEQSQPGSVYGTGEVVESAGGGSSLPQKRIYYRQLLAIGHQDLAAGRARALAERAVHIAMVTLPDASLLSLAVVGILLWRWRSAWVVAAVLPLFFFLYALNPFFLQHYTLPLLAPMALCVVLGSRAIAGAWPEKKGLLDAFLFLSVLLLSAASIPEISFDVQDRSFAMPLMDRVQEVLAPIHEPAVVFFRFHPGSNVENEPVYNWDVAWPDDARIIRAHDLGARDVELLRYYQARQPDRIYYLFDRADGSITRLGTAQQAERALRPANSR